MDKNEEQKKVAILYDDTPEKEPEEDPYAEVIRLARMGPASQEEYIKRNFTITRKQ